MALKRLNLKQKPDENGYTRKQAVALGYEPGKDNAPRVLARGLGVIAEQIIALAKKNGIPIHEDTALAAALSNINIDEEIPPELYIVVAEVLAYIYRVQARRDEMQNPNRS